MLLNSIVKLDEAIINKIASHAFLGSTTPISIPVYYINPEEEFVIEEFPSIIVYRIGNVRYGSRIFLPKFRSDYKYDEQGKLEAISERESPLPISFLYVIRLYYEYNEDGAEMNIMMLKHFPPQPKPCYITIDGVDYDLVQIHHKLLNSDDKQFGLIKYKEKDKTRVFCDQYMYFCDTDLDIFDKVERKTVKEIIIEGRTY